MRTLLLILIFIPLFASAQIPPILPIPIGTGASTAVTNYAKWNPATKGVNLTVSADSLTITTVNGQIGIIAGNTGKSTGKWYWEHLITFCLAAGNYEMFGITSTLPTLGNNGRLIGNPSYVFLKANATTTTSYFYRFLPAAAGTTIGPALGAAYLATGDVVSCVMDLDNMTFTIYKNGTIAGIDVPITIATTWYPSYGADGSGSGVISNFGQNAWDARTLALRTTKEGEGFTIGLIAN